MKLKFSVRQIVTIGVLAGLSFIIMLLELPLPLMPGFLKIDFSDIPAVIAAFAFGPVSAIFVELIKNLLHLVFRGSTAGIGEMANFLVGVAYVVPAGLIYKYIKKRKGAIIALLVGTLSTIVFASILNYFVLLPLYASVLHFPTEAVISEGTKANESIVDIKSLIVLGIAPFNAIKYLAASLVTMLIYKRVSPILHKK